MHANDKVYDPIPDGQRCEASVPVGLMASPFGRNRSGFTFVEVIIAIVLVTLMSISFIASMVYASSEARNSRDFLYAESVMTMVGEQVSASDWTRLGDQTIPTTSTLYERQFNAPITIQADTNSARIAPTITATVTFSGWGRVASATGTTINATLPTGQANWATNQWAGNYVTLVSGRGAGQVVRVVSNTGNAMVVTPALSGTAAGSMNPTPDSTTVFAVNDCKTARIRVDWFDNGTTRTMTRTVAVPRPATGSVVGT
jgi:hypothetical protein